MDTPATPTDASATEPQISTVPTVAPETETPGGSVDGDTISILSSLREMRSNLGQQARPLEVPVPGYENLLVIRYKWVPFKDLSQNADDLAKVTEPTEQMVRASADTLVTCCQEVMILVEKKLRPMAQDGVPIIFGDPRLPENLDFPATDSAIGNCRAVFNNEYALIRTANTVLEWLQDTTKRVDERFLGN